MRKFGIKSRVAKILATQATAFRTTRARLISSVSNHLRSTGLERPSRYLLLIRGVRRFAPSWRFLAQYEGLLVARSAGWAAAASIFQELASYSGKRRQRRGTPATNMLAPPRPSPALRLALPAEKRPFSIPRETAANIAVYTAFFGIRPNLPLLHGGPEGLRFLCFTDQPIDDVPGWEMVPANGSRESALLHQICPHKVLPSAGVAAEWSLFLAPEKVMVGNLHTLITRWLLREEFALWRHPWCIDWHDLIERHLVMGTESAAELLRQARNCEAVHLPRNQGAYDTGVIWRRHANPAVAELMDSWWRLQAELPGASDVTLYRLLSGADRRPLSPAVIPEAIGSGDANLFLARQVRHLPARRAQLPKSAGLRRIPVTFLYSDAHPNEGGTQTRAKALSALIASHFPELYHVSCVGNPRGVRDQIVIVNQRAIWDNTVEALSDLRKRNIAVIGDWMDAPVEKEKAELFDAHMAFSFTQMLGLNHAYPEIPAYHVTHHVNADIPRVPPPTDKLRTGYFGSLRNTTLPSSLSGAVSLIDVWAKTGTRWVDRFQDYNCHWIVRMDPVTDGHKKRYGGWKPFIKGFTAAACGSVVIVTRDDLNAAHYLGDDYPFYAESLAAADLEMAWARVASAFGGHDWRMAQEIMRQVAARSSDAQVCSEFKAMLDDVLS